VSLSSRLLKGEALVAFLHTRPLAPCLPLSCVVVIVTIACLYLFISSLICIPWITHQSTMKASRIYPLFPIFGLLSSCTVGGDSHLHRTLYYIFPNVHIRVEEVAPLTMLLLHSADGEETRARSCCLELESRARFVASSPHTRYRALRLCPSIVNRW
jgi:hypothetical protein